MATGQVFEHEAGQVFAIENAISQAHLLERLLVQLLHVCLLISRAHLLEILLVGLLQVCLLQFKLGPNDIWMTVVATSYDRLTEVCMVPSKIY